MHLIRYYVCLLCIGGIFFFSGCKKDRITHTIQGQLFSCGSNIPIANQRVAIYQRSERGSSLILRGKGETDAEGKFNFNYTTTQYYNRLEFVLGQGESVILSGLDTKENISNLNVYRLEDDIVTPLIVSLNVQNPYTNNDTLYFYDTSFPSNTRKIAGPFASGRTFSQIYSASYYLTRDIAGNEIEYRCGLNRNYSEELNSYFTVPFATYCEADTAYVTININ